MRNRIRSQAEVPRLHRGRRRMEREPWGDRARDRGRRMDRRDRDQYEPEYLDEDLGDLPASREPRERGRQLSRGIETAGTRRAFGRGLRDQSTRDRGGLRGRDEPRGMGRSRRPRDSAEDDLMDLDLDAILEVDEDEITEEFPGEPGVLEPEGPEGPEGEVCPPGCVPEEEVDEVLDEEDKKDENGEDKDKKEENGKEDEEDEETKEAAAEPAVEPKSEVTAEAEPATEEITAETETAEPSRAKWAPLYNERDIQKLDRAAEVVMMPFLNQEDPHYVVLANGRPVGEVRRSDLELDEDHQELFTADAFPKGVIDAIEQLGASNVLGDLELRYYAAQVTAQQTEASAKTAVQADLEEAFQTRSADLKERFFNNVMLAVEASCKNVFLRDPLRDAIRDNFRGAGIPDAVAVDLYEDAMQRAGADYMQGIMRKADEWLGFDKDALGQIEQSIREADYSHPVDRGMQLADEVIGAGVVGAPPQAPQAPPLRTQAARVGLTAEPTDMDQSEAAVRTIMRNASGPNRGR